MKRISGLLFVVMTLFVSGKLFSANQLNWTALDIEPGYVLGGEEGVILSLKVYNESAIISTNITVLEVKIDSATSSPAATKDNIEKLILWNSTDAQFDSASDTKKQEETTFTGDPGTINFDAFATVNLAAGATTYFFIQYKLKSTVSDGDNIDLKLINATNQGGLANNPVLMANPLNSGSSGSPSYDTISVNLDHFTISGAPSSVFSDTPFDLTIYANNKGTGVVPDFSGSVVLSASSGNIYPVSGGPFVTGIWQGEVTTDVIEGSIIITCNDQEGHTGTSSPILIKAREESKAAVSYPNPFSPETGTRIRFYMASSGTVRVTIYTLSGEQVLAEEFSYDTGGEKDFEWYAKNAAGDIVESGGYICLIEKESAGVKEREKIKIAVVR